MASILGARYTIVVVEAEAGRVGSLFVVPIPDENFGVDPFTGVAVIGGQPVSISWICREQDVERAFGKSTRADEDPEETVLFYEIGGRVEREIELTPEGRIKTIAIYSYSQIVTGAGYLKNRIATKTLPMT